MSPDIIEKSFFPLLRTGLWNSIDSELEIPTAKGWNQLLQLARREAVLGIIYHGISILPDKLMPPSELRIGLLVETDQISRQSEKVKAVSEEIVSFFRAASLSPIIMKGPEAAKYYPVPSLRSSGDIDLFFTPVEFPAAIDIVKSKGIKTSHEPDGSDVYRWNGIIIEHHQRYFDLHSKTNDLPAIPSSEAELLMLSAHILKHAIGVGVGLRQICDIAEAFVALNGKYDSKELAEFSEKNGLRKWNDLLYSYIVEYLGVSPSILPAYKTVKTSPLMKIILSGGNFGQYRVGRDKFRNRKLKTMTSFASRLPFSLRIAPTETLRTIRELVKGNLE